MGGSNFRQKNLLKDLIYLGQTRPVNKQTVKGLFRFALEPILDMQSPKALVLYRLFDTVEIEGVLKRLDYTRAEVYSFDSVTKGENLERENIWDDTEFLVVLSPRYSAVLLWDYSTEPTKDKSCLYYLLNSKDVNNVIRIISNNSKIDLMRYTQEYTPERRGNELLNSAVHKFIDFADSYVEETMLSQAENQIISNNDDAIKKYEYISTKARAISHDIKNHLSVIDLYSKIIEKRLDMACNKELQESLKNAVSSVRKSKDAIDSLLSELRTIKGLNLQTFDFSSILENTLTLVDAKALEAGVTLEIATEYKGNILVDEHKFLNVFMNLLYNAIEACGENGLVRITTEETQDNMLKIFVTDNGCGIEEDLQSKIFDEGYTSKITGNGLGLYISKESMKEQYGDLKLISSKKGETTFEMLVSRI